MQSDQPSTPCSTRFTTGFYYYSYSLFMWIWFTKSRGKQYKNLIIIIMIITLIIIPRGAERSEFIISSQYVNRVWVQASCKLAAFIFIHPMVSAMTSYNSLTSRRNLFLGNIRLKAIMTKVFMKSCLFIVCKTMFTIGESQAISHANRTANTRTPNCQSSQGKI